MELCFQKNKIKKKTTHILECTGAVVSSLNVHKWQKWTPLPVFGSGPISSSIWCRSRSQVLVSSRRLTKQTKDIRTQLRFAQKKRTQIIEVNCTVPDLKL